MSTFLSTPKMTEEPRTFLAMRAQRLVKILALDGPPSIVQGEVCLINQALVALLAKESPGLLDHQAADAVAERYRCLDLLGDVPGETLEQRVSTLVGYQIQLQLQVQTLKDQSLHGAQTALQPKG